MNEKYIIKKDRGFGTEFENEEAYWDAYRGHLQKMIANGEDRFAPDLTSPPAEGNLYED